MMTTSPSCEPQYMADINITPFTDVLLVLLIIFILFTALTAPPGFQKQLSNSRLRTITDPVGSHQILVEVTAKDRVSFDGKIFPFAQLYQRMTEIIAFHARQGYSRHIVLYADMNASYNVIIKILDAARQAGDEDVGFMVQ